MDIQVDAPFINDSNYNILQVITECNKKLPPLITSVPKTSGTSIALWPHMFKASLMTHEGRGLQNAFCALLSLGHRVGEDTDQESAIKPPLKKQKLDD